MKLLATPRSSRTRNLVRDGTPYLTLRAAFICSQRFESISPCNSGIRTAAARLSNTSAHRNGGRAREAACGARSMPYLQPRPG